MKPLKEPQTLEPRTCTQSFEMIESILDRSFFMATDERSEEGPPTSEARRTIELLIGHETNHD